MTTPTRRLLPGLILLGLLLSPAVQAAYPLSVGCPWIPEAVNIKSHNFGYPDELANYSSANLPNASAADGVQMQIKGRYPHARYFSFQLATGFSFGNLYDQIADASLSSDGGIQPDANPADLPPADFAADGDSYTVTIKYQDVPQPPLAREPNVLYAGASKTLYHNRQVIMRVYLPDPGVDEFGGVPLPDLIYQGPLGTINVNDTPDQIPCQALAAIWTHYSLLFNPAVPSINPKFAPVSVLGNLLGLYPNGDSNYLRAQPSLLFGPMVVVRSKAPSYPPLPPETIASPDVRYWSLCQNQLFSTKGVGCIVDRDMVLQDDGTFTAVISPAAARPATADAAHGYNWLDWGPSADAFVVIRQILARPGFAGDYAQAVSHPFQSVQTSLGDWAPEITYCDPATFDSAAAAGGAAVMAACHAAYPAVVPALSSRH